MMNIYRWRPNLFPFPLEATSPARPVLPSSSLVASRFNPFRVLTGTPGMSPVLAAATATFIAPCAFCAKSPPTSEPNRKNFLVPDLRNKKFPPYLSYKLPKSPPSRAFIPKESSYIPFVSDAAHFAQKVRLAAQLGSKNILVRSAPHKKIPLHLSHKLPKCEFSPLPTSQRTFLHHVRAGPCAFCAKSPAIPPDEATGPPGR
jgi:hypothetical protein